MREPADPIINDKGAATTAIKKKTTCNDSRKVFRRKIFSEMTVRA